MILKSARQGIPPPYTKPSTNNISGKPIPNTTIDNIKSILENYFPSLYDKNKPKSKNKN
tara:strand:+ start:72 stop:248 length:177 start_codon:yes stop_codon:yes gene_type:complete